MSGTSKVMTQIGVVIIRDTSVNLITITSCVNQTNKKNNVAKHKHDIARLINTLTNTVTIL